MNFNHPSDSYNPYSGYGEQQSAQYGGGEYQTYDGGYDEQQYAQDYGDQQYDASQYEESLFYPSQSPFVAHPIDAYRSAGCPISAISFENNDNKKSQSLLFVASHTSKQGGSAGDKRRKKSTSRLDKALHRGSRVTILYKDEEGLDSYYGNRSLYSSFVAHPEAPSTTLDKVHGTLFGGGKPIYDVSTSVASRHANRGIKARPASAFGPCYGPPAYVHNSHNLAMNIGNKHNQRPEEKYCMGVSSIFQVATPHFGTGGRVCSISPHGIRIHTRGGMVMSDNSNLLSGLTCGTLSGENSHYVTAGGMSCTDSRPQNVHSIDIARDLQVISSMTLVSGARRPGSEVCVTDIAANFERNNAVVGCSDGTFRLLDAGRRNAEVAKADAQIGGVAKVAVSGNLICATGYSSQGVSSPSSPLPYPFPDNNALVYDLRYLGRGGIPHSSAGARFVSFLPAGSIPGQADELLLIGSGQTYGGFELIAPFDSSGGAGSLYFQPELNSGEAMSTVNYSNGELVLGTSQGRVLQYVLANYQKTMHSPTSSPARNVGSNFSSEKVNLENRGASLDEKLDMPPFVPPPSELAVDPRILSSNYNKPESSLQGWNVFNAYSLYSRPVLSTEQSSLHPRYSRVNVGRTTLGPIYKQPLILPVKRHLSEKLRTSNDKSEGERVKVFPTTTVLGDDVSFDRVNPNRLLYGKEARDACCYEDKKYDKNVQEGQERSEIPSRYLLTDRPRRRDFDYSFYNETNLFVGWDYDNSFSNSFIASILALLYFNDPVRTTALSLQLRGPEMSIQTGKNNVSLTAELGLLFNLVDSLSANGMVQPNRPSVKAFNPSSFISAFTLLSEAKTLALVDGIAGSLEIARRPEAVYRFIMQYIDKELTQLLSVSGDTPISWGKLVDRLQGLSFVSIVEFTSGNGAPKLSMSRQTILDLEYNPRFHARESVVRFGEILRYSLCKEAPLRAWCEETREYEQVLQRKFATSLPQVMSLSCCCAGTGAGKSFGLEIWQQDVPNWLPLKVEVFIASDKSITVKELAKTGSEAGEEWHTFESGLTLSKQLSRAWESEIPPGHSEPASVSYRLDAVVSFVRCRSGESEGHHVVHIRKPSKNIELDALRRQLKQVDECLNEESNPSTLVSGVPLQERLESLQETIKKTVNNADASGDDEWLLLNGFVVSRVTSEDARSFCASFKEPVIVVYSSVQQTDSLQPSSPPTSPRVSEQAMETLSISNGKISKLIVEMPSKGDCLAIDAEFVCVQPESSFITLSGSKKVLREPRNALARLSIISCDNDEILLDDYVLPNEPVVDYLTRFSGIRQADLDPEHSPHHLITPQEAYQKVRYLMERGCIFVGHGLSEDFKQINICIPPNQVIDTAEIYHQPASRYISLRYLTNYVLKRDMQQDVHDSVEDARAALELYKRAMQLRKDGTFDDYISQLYKEGQNTQFRVA